MNVCYKTNLVESCIDIVLLNVNTFYVAGVRLGQRDEKVIRLGYDRENIHINYQGKLFQQQSNLEKYTVLM